MSPTELETEMGQQHVYYSSHKLLLIEKCRIILHSTQNLTYSGEQSSKLPLKQAHNGGAGTQIGVLVPCEHLENTSRLPG